MLQKIQGWLSPPNPWENHKVIHESLHGGTGAWLIQGDTYVKWRSSGLSSLLWIHGKRPYLVPIFFSEANGHGLCSGFREECYLVG